MRSVYIQQPLEYQIEVEGESWNQGEVVKGQIRIRNMSSKTVAVKTSQIILAHGLKKAFKEGTMVPWEVLEKQVVAQDIALQAGSELTFGWNFNLSTDCPITDKQGGLYLLFGGDEALTEGGRLNLQINLHPILQNYLQTFTTQFRFLEKYQKRKSELTEVKLIPPDSREYPNMDYVLCFLRIHDEQLEAHYRFKMSGLGRTGEKMTVTKKIVSLNRAYLRENIFSPEVSLTVPAFAKILIKLSI